MNTAKDILREVPQNKAEPPLDPQSSNWPLKKILIFSVIGVCVVTALVLTYYWFVYSQTHITTDNAYIESDLYPVNCRIMGYVKDVFVKENEEIKKDQVLAALDDTDFNVELSFKKAKLDKTLADMNRAKKLIKLKAISRADYESIETALIANQADYDGTMLKLKYTKVLAPADGVIGKKVVQVGQFVQPGQGLFVIVPRTQFWIKANYKETQLTKILSGQKVEIKVDAFPGKTFLGHVESVFPSSGARLSILPPENATGNFTKVVQRIPVKISIDSGPVKLLRSGMSVSSTILVKE
jgi:membrane fusion protein (multidrug efflux system)